MIDPKTDFAIAFHGEAFETFQNIVDKMDGYGVTVTTQAGETIEAVLIGADRTSEWGDTVVIVRAEDGDWPEPAVYKDPENQESVRVGRVEVH